MFGDEALKQNRLRVGGVLILVDEEVSVLVGDCRRDRRIGKQPCCLCEQGSVVDERPRTECSVIAIKERRESAPVGPAGRSLGEVARADELLAAPQDEVGHFIGKRARREQRSERRRPHFG